MSYTENSRVGWHTVVTHDSQGMPHVQCRGPGHVVEGSERIIDLLPGETAVIRHIFEEERAP